MRADEREREREGIRQERVAQNNANAEWDRAWRQRMDTLNLLMRARELAAEPFDKLRSS
jgi:hypothetical protein